jgi:thymidylate synthase (FAD)
MIEVTYVDHMGNDLTTVNAARVSFGKKSGWEAPFEDCDESLLKLSDRDTKLIKYLAKHKHISPFGHCFASFHVKAPIFVIRQLVKHQYLRINEVSRRYITSEPEFYVPEVWRGRAEDVKQGSDGVADTSITSEYINNQTRIIYKNLLDDGVAPEQARMVLPQSTMTEWYWSGSLDAFAAMCNLRCKPDTQYESQLVANQIDTIMSDLYPVSWEALRGR